MGGQTALVWHARLQEKPVSLCRPFLRLFARESGLRFPAPFLHAQEVYFYVYDRNFKPDLCL